PMRGIGVEGRAVRSLPDPLPARPQRRPAHREHVTVMRRTALVALLTLLLPTVCGAAPPFYSGAPIRGRVVDAETDEPLTGVHVVTETTLSTGLFIHGEHVERLHVAETVTDASGDYELPAWGPKARPTFSELHGGDPTLIYFKPGYRPEWRGDP